MPIEARFEPIYNAECLECEHSPVVGYWDDEGRLRSTRLCGPCFFSDRLMADEDLWNLDSDNLS